jgi:hypothetical protein
LHRAFEVSTDRVPTAIMQNAIAAGAIAIMTWQGVASSEKVAQVGFALNSKPRHKKERAADFENGEQNFVIKHPW